MTNMILIVLLKISRQAALSPSFVATATFLQSHLEIRLYQASGTIHKEDSQHYTMS